MKFKDMWEPVQNIDLMKRKPSEWAKIYHLKLYGCPESLWSEYEFCFNLNNLKYNLLPDKSGEYDKANEMELRANEIYRDILMSADPSELIILKEEKRFIETEWIRKKMLQSTGE